MSELVVEVCAVQEKKPHPNADRLEFVRLKGWWVIVQKDLLEVGQPVVYIPPDSVITEAHAERLGITKYCNPYRKRADGTRPPGLRVKAARIRNEPSYGTIDSTVDPSWTLGQNVRDLLGVTKWEPPVSIVDGDSAPGSSLFPMYTSIEHIWNYPDAFVDGMEVVITEKLHGMNCRLGMINVDGEPTFYAGSHKYCRKKVDSQGRTSNFWKPLDLPGVADMIRSLYTEDVNSVVVYGELINTQKGFRYGVEGGNCGFRVFDISVNLKYLDYDRVVEACRSHNVEMVPILYRGSYSQQVVESYVDGPTTVCDSDKAGDFKGREGVVVKPVVECTSRALPGSGRVIGKAVSVDYHDYVGKKTPEVADSSDA